MIKNNKSKISGVYLLPNLITTGALLCGFFAIISSINGNIVTAVFSILIAMILDGLDGRIARLTNTQTSFGAYYDSLSDLLCFGIAPALLMYIWSLSNFNMYGWHWSKIAWISCFIYVAATAIRLARFNSKLIIQDKKYFNGLASPAAAAVIMCYAWLIQDSNLNVQNFNILSLLILIILSILMISNITYYSFKDINLRHKIPHIGLFIIVLTLSFISFDPPMVLLTFFSLYALSGPILLLIRYTKKISNSKAGKRPSASQ
ncbi:MAG: CDP-diacylglycerol--serine O-phosphatidyltransferase [Gammaproteobacteria bacterium]|nr:CDP-diacylglycerol--serine O-phosphatidyltransferase [Gammaproteobacteria bacterium]|tara:strand:+ start:98 stop:880 length:783 start_codon:yes stop_codon:yes gene_type:complete